MRLVLLTPFLAALSWNVPGPDHFLYPAIADTAVIHHVQDGIVTEWPDTLFQSDKGTNIQYAADNDGQNLYVAMKITDFRMQMKLMRMGMNLYIDLKGKKKENRGIEFPIKRENEGGGGFSNNQRADPNQQGNNQQRSFDKKAMRSRFAMSLLAMKLFGFSDDEPAQQELQKEGSANLNYSWDSTDVMYIEYLIPLKLLGDAGSLNQKTISIGWKINGVEMSSSFSASAPPITTPSTSRRGGSTPSGTAQNQNNSFNSGGSSDKMMEEQSFWMKYVFH